ncbi:hypothetical protein [Breoghania sp.]|uniref:hypothetical protein n=1 Tax=Breoghania sp. TaxID=2065378 RepID=UPI0029CA0F25|nr:hypothetical protein [Breoghania sp.]
MPLGDLVTRLKTSLIPGLNGWAIAGAFFLSASSVAPVLAQAEGSERSDEVIALELNGAQTVSDACRATFVVRNGLSRTIDELGLEIVVFDEKGGVSDMTALNLGAMPAGKTRVLRFRVARRGCDGVSSLLINDVRTCKGAGLDPAGCLSRLKTSSRIEIGLGL